MAAAAHPTLALIRHGQSEWNLANRFTGWVDVDLTDKGITEARKAGQLLKETGTEFIACYTSVQRRAIRTLWLALEEMDYVWLPVTKNWQLNERHYGGLTGLNKQETREKHGDDQVHIWRRSYDVPPPPIADDHPENPNHDPQYAHLAKTQLPASESLKMTLDRVQPYWEAEIAPRVRAGESLIIAAHGNSLRALVKLLMQVSDTDIPGVEIPTGNPLVFTFEEGSLNPLSADYLDADRAQALPPLPSPQG
ncbi:MAG: 2,3-diphosphoglycerate-dependent phosphoglycerate mutase [Pseudomonadota bacterium]